MYTRPRKRTFKGEKTPFSIRLPEDLHKFFKEMADDADLGVGDVIADFLDRAATEILDREKRIKETKPRKGA